MIRTSSAYLRLFQPKPVAARCTGAAALLAGQHSHNLGAAATLLPIAVNHVCMSAEFSYECRSIAVQHTPCRTATIPCPCSCGTMPPTWPERGGKSEQSKCCPLAPAAHCSSDQGMPAHFVVSRQGSRALIALTASGVCKSGCGLLSPADVHICRGRLFALAAVLTCTAHLCYP